MYVGRGQGYSHSRRSGGRRAFTLIELLVALGIIAVFLGILLPSLSSARGEGTKVRCLANLRELGMALAMYSNDDENGYTAPVHPRAETSWWYEGEYEFGGKTGLGYYAHEDFKANHRLLNQYAMKTAGASLLAMYECPGDEGIPRVRTAGRPDGYDFDTYFFQPFALNRKIFDVTGTSYRLNNHIDFTRLFPQFSTHFYGPYMRPVSQVPDPGTTVILEETIAEVAKWNRPTYVTMGWHRKTNTFNVLMLDGHAAPIYLSGQSDLSNAYPDYWVLRGQDWRMDCYPRPPVCDKPRHDCETAG
jgi:prepilin-type N-terminal cleavage/methylation domain-containing protein/prepilin-type processing-associated H-X9-DG protein